MSSSSAPRRPLIVSRPSELVDLLRDSKRPIEDFKASYTHFLALNKGFFAKIVSDGFYSITPKTTFSGCTLAAHAAQFGRVDALKFLAEQKADFTEALHRAVWFGQVEVLRHLLATMPAQLIRKECKRESEALINSTPFYLAFRTNNSVIILTFLSSVSVEMDFNQQVDAIIRMVRRDSVEDRKIFVAILNRASQSDINKFICFNLASLGCYYSGLAKIMEKGAHANIVAVLDKASPFAVAKEAYQKKYRRADFFEEKDIYHHINKNFLLSSSQKQTLKDYISNVVFVIYGSILENPEEYIQLLSAMIPLEPEKIIEHDQWIAIIEKALSNAKTNNSRMSPIRDKLHALLGRIHYSRHLSQDLALVHLAKAQACWDNIVESKVIDAKDSLYIALHFTGSPNELRKRKALAHALAGASAGCVDAKVILLRTTLGLTGSLPDTTVDSLPLEPRSVLNDGKTPVSLFENKKDDRLNKVYENTMNALDLIAVGNSYKRSCPAGAQELSAMQAADAKRVIEFKGMFSHPLAKKDDNPYQLDEDTKKFIIGHLGVTEKYLTRNIKLFKESEAMFQVEMAIALSAKQPRSQQNIFCALDQMQKSIETVKNNFCEASLRKMQKCMTGFKLMVKQQLVLNNAEQEQYLRLVARVEQDVLHAVKIVKQAQIPKQVTRLHSF